MIYDPERALWKPRRRSFLFMFGAAIVAPSLPQIAPPPPVYSLSVVQGTVAHQRLYDYAFSTLVEVAALEPKVPFVGFNEPVPFQLSEELLRSLRVRE